jgi:hypothetical protein
MRPTRLVTLVSVAVAGTVALAFGGVRLLGGETVELLPNLDAAAPGEIRGRSEETPDGVRFYLGFGSAAGNIGDGALSLVARRPARSQPRMRLEQEIRRSDGTSRTVPVAATLGYVRSATHSHWHMLGFMRYELRPAAGGRPVRDRKTGFCLGDRYRLGIALPRSRTTPEFTDECGKSRPELLSLRVGISVGFGDDYAPHLEGQEFDVTSLDAGRYLLVHRVNPQRLLLESDYGDNVSSLAFSLAWPDGRELPPRIDVLERCPGAESCG